jgi:hypothetical protein
MAVKSKPPMAVKSKPPALRVVVDSMASSIKLASDDIRLTVSGVYS